MFHERLKASRNALKISQLDLSKKLGVSQQTIGSWETGRTEPSMMYLQLLPKELNVSIVYLLGMTDDPSPSGVTGKLKEIETNPKLLKLLLDTKDIPEEVIDKVAAYVEEIKNRDSK